MSAKQILSNLKSARERKQKLEAELAAVQLGPRTKAEALAAIEAGFEKEAEAFRADLRDVIGDVPPFWQVPPEDRRKAPRAPQVHLVNASPGHILSETLRRKNASLDNTRGFLNVLALLAFPALRVEVQRALDELPKSAYGLSQRDRDVKEKQLRADLEATVKDIQRLEADWQAETGVPVPA